MPLLTAVRCCAKIPAVHHFDEHQNKGIGGSNMLTIEHLSKTYPGGKRAVDDLNLVVHAGEIC